MYGTLHRTGRSVFKNKGTNMASQELGRQAIHFSSDLEDFFLIHTISKT